MKPLTLYTIASFSVGALMSGIAALLSTAWTSIVTSLFMLGLVAAALALEARQ